jgi:hypothetical protein
MTPPGSRPCLNPSLVLTALDDEYLAFHPDNERLHRLNPGAALAIEMCDGTRDLDDIRDALLPLLGGSGWRTCHRWIETARRDGLLTCDVTAGRLATPIGSGPDRTGGQAARAGSHTRGVCLSETRHGAHTRRSTRVVSVRRIRPDCRATRRGQTCLHAVF